MLEKMGDKTKFIVFGEDKRVPEDWLKRYGYLADSVPFFFLSENGKIEQLSKIKITWLLTKTF